METIARTDYKDDILDTSVNMSRKYRMITNEDGTVSLEDVTSYVQYGDTMSAEIINTIFRKFGGFSFVEITQSEYDSLPTPRPEKTLYIIKKE